MRAFEVFGTLAITALDFISQLILFSLFDKPQHSAIFFLFSQSNLNILEIVRKKLLKQSNDLTLTTPKHKLRKEKAELMKKCSGT